MSTRKLTVLITFVTIMAAFSIQFASASYAYSDTEQHVSFTSSNTENGKITSDLCLSIGTQHSDFRGNRLVVANCGPDKLIFSYSTNGYQKALAEVIITPGVTKFFVLDEVKTVDGAYYASEDELLAGKSRGSFHFSM